MPLDLFLLHVRVEKGLAWNSVEAYGSDLRRYLDHLHLTLEPRGLESRWRRPGDTAALAGAVR